MEIIALNSIFYITGVILAVCINTFSKRRFPEAYYYLQPTKWYLLFMSLIPYYIMLKDKNQILACIMLIFGNACGILYMWVIMFEIKRNIIGRRVNEKIIAKIKKRILDRSGAN